MKGNLIVYTDGSFSSSDRISTIAFLYFLESTPNEIKFFSASKNTNFRDDNNVLEGEAISHFFENIKNTSYEKITLFTDSQNVLNRLVVCPEKYDEPFFNNLKNEIPNNCELHWVKGHSKNYYNFIVDMLCKLAREENKKHTFQLNNFNPKEKSYTLSFFDKFKPYMKDKKMLNYLVQNNFK